MSGCRNCGIRYFYVLYQINKKWSYFVIETWLNMLILYIAYIVITNTE